MSTKQIDTFENIAQSISTTVTNPINLGYDNGVDITNYFSDKIISYSNYDLLLKDLEDNNFVV